MLPSFGISKIFWVVLGRLICITLDLQEKNACADFLAKYGAQQDHALVTIEQLLARMSLLLLVDVIGVSS